MLRHKNPLHGKILVEVRGKCFCWNLGDPALSNIIWVSLHNSGVLSGLGLTAANSIFSIKSIVHSVPTHFIIWQVAHSNSAPRSGLSWLPIPSYTSDVQVQHFLHMYPPVSIYTRCLSLPGPLALCLPAFSCHVCNGPPSNFTTASGKWERKGKITRCSILTWPLSKWRVLETGILTPHTMQI